MPETSEKSEGKTLENPTSEKSENSIPIEPLSNKERGKQGKTPNYQNDPDFPDDWKDKAKTISDAIDDGYKFYKRRVGEKVYMLLRKGRRKDISLGLATEEREGKLFHFYPYLVTQAGIPKPPEWVSEGARPQGRTFLSTPISRIGIIPRDYVPTIEVIRYFQILKKNGFPGDFSKFINDVVEHHMTDCHGISLPVMLEEEEEG